MLQMCKSKNPKNYRNWNKIMSVMQNVGIVKKL